ncbi:MAG: HAMP domain-containing histidine kinase [Gammaproteobacteria bacterium]|nr:HAMP domain-containing histidine kinase [Gammaproteobacteria bacterium]
MRSLRRKITAGYYLFAVSMIVLAVFAYASLRFLEERLDWGDAISTFLDTTLEMRRFEKNYFLYGVPGDAAAARDYARQIQDLLRDHSVAFRQLATAAELARIGDRLRRYDDQIARLQRAGIGRPEAVDAEQTLRELGHDLSRVAERFNADERAAMRALLNGARVTLVGALAAVTVVSLFLAYFLSRAVAWPLRELERDVAAVGQGRLNALPARSGDRELMRFTEAFNRTLHELEQRRRHLLQSEKLASLGTLVAGVAHELNNPLSNISTTNQLLQEELDAADHAQICAWLQDIDEQTERARRIVATLLDSARDSPYSTAPTRLRNVLDKSVALVGSRGPQGVAVVVDVAGDPVIDADAQKLQQVFINLIGNALEAGGRQIQVRCVARHAQLEGPPLDAYVWTRSPTTMDLEDNAVFISVVDDGPGIPAEILSKVFDPFFTTKDVGHGSGLGLHVVKEIIERHGGCIGVVSQPGEGSRFMVLLPRRQPRVGNAA